MYLLHTTALEHKLACMYSYYRTRLGRWGPTNTLPIEKTFIARRSIPCPQIVFKRIFRLKYMIFVFTLAGTVPTTFRATPFIVVPQNLVWSW